MIYVYNYTNGQINPNFTKYNSLNALSKELNIVRDTIKRYLNTNVPYKSNLFFISIVTDLTLINDLVCKVSEGLELNRTLTKKVLIYNENGEILNFESKEVVAKFLDVQFRTITYHLDNWIKGGINGYYLFSKELNNLELEKLTNIFKLRKTNNCVIWVYEIDNLQSPMEKFNSMQKAAEYFKVDYRSIQRHLDTNKVTLKDGKLVLFYSKELTMKDIKGLNIENKKNEIINIWVYKSVNNILELINNNEPTFNSRSEAAKLLKFSSKTITKYLDTNKSYKDLYFYSKKL